ncbi:hypothetical protein [Nonomuraea antimicrobica]|uniref:hypothetical protein n=1 Tax=Nonomuraea antimicrobica TaxID=561173 RepID=UPI0031E5A0F5
MAMSRARRAELQRRAREIRLDCQRRAAPAEQTAQEILAAVPELLPLEAYRLAYGWSRPAALEALAALYRAAGLPEPPTTPAMLCRWEHGTTTPSREYAAALCRLYRVPPERLGLRPDLHATSACGHCVCRQPEITVGEQADTKGDPMRRRALLAAVGLSIPIHLIQKVDDVLAVPLEPEAPADHTEIAQQLQVARRQYDTSALSMLVAGLPALLTAARDMAERSGTPGGWALLASCYDLATDTMNKVGRPATARLTADRAVLYADRSGDPVATGASARALGMVLRTEGRHETAAAVIQRAIDRLDAAGLRTPAQANTYMRLVCASAYTASWAGDRAGALDQVGDAHRAADRLARLASRPGAGRAFVRLYEVDIHYALKDTGAALRVGRGLHPGMFPTPERRGRLHTDMARAWWQAGQPEEAAAELLTAHKEAPAEVRDRPSIRAIADNLATHHPRLPGVRQLTAAVRA